MRTLRVGNQVIGDVEVSDAEDPQERLDQNLSLAALAVGRALGRFQPFALLTADERYRLVLLDVTGTVVGLADEPTIEEVRRRFEGGDDLSFLTALVRRAGGGSVCGLCGKEFRQHKVEPRLADIMEIQILCNGDLVKL